MSVVLGLGGGKGAGAAVSSLASWRLRASRSVDLEDIDD